MSVECWPCPNSVYASEGEDSPFGEFLLQEIVDASSANDRCAPFSIYFRIRFGVLPSVFFCPLTDFCSAATAAPQADENERNEGNEEQYRDYSRSVHADTLREGRSLA